ncbi:MAG: OadG family transporter subunit [Rikenellaceae bacterium]
MKRILSKNIIALVIAFMSVFVASAQGIKDIVINEVLVKNVDSYEDGFGHRVGWIELRNVGYSNVNLASAILEVTKNDGQTVRYRIPKNDANTVVGPQGYVLFFAGGESTKGTFYTNFTLDNTKAITLWDASGKGDPISTVSYSYAEQKPNTSIGFITKVEGEEPVWGVLAATSPASTNETIEKISRSELFLTQDPRGFAMAISAMSVVFLALLTLFVVFKRLGVLLVSFANRKEHKAKAAVSATPVAAPTKKKEAELMKDEVNGEVIAAIAIALQQYESDLHDIESEVVTINRVARAYSPWSSKIYGINNQLNR